jgi:predicted metal-dependent peptidase
MGIWSPGTVDDGIGHIVVAVDDSGSVDRNMLARFGGECQAILDEGIVDKITLVIADDGVHHCAEYSRGDILDFAEALGRGGTSYTPTFRYVADNVDQDVTGLVYFTDLDCTTFGAEPDYPVLWAAYEQPLFRHLLPGRFKTVPFGDCMELTE